MPASVVDPDMALLTNGLEILDKFKKPDNDNESDEESFHLLSDGEDDAEKTDICTELSEVLKDETEEELLNKLGDSSSLNEAATVPDIDEKLEQKLLEDEDPVDADSGGLSTIDQANAEDMGNFKSKTNTIEESNTAIVSEIENVDKVKENEEKSKPDNTDTENTESNNEMPDKENQLKDIDCNISSTKADIVADIDNHTSKTNSEENRDKEDLTMEEVDRNLEDDTNESREEDITMEEVNRNLEDDTNETHEEDTTMKEVDRNLEDDSNESGDKLETAEKELMEVDESAVLPKDKDIDEHLLDESEVCDTQSEATDGKIEQSERDNECPESETSHAETELQTLLDTAGKSDEMKIDDIIPIKNEVDEEGLICNVESVVHVEDDNQTENEAPKSPNLESDDLLDISIIRDADEDDAHLAECSNDANSIEKDENDETSDERMDEVEDEDVDMTESEKPSESGDNDEQMSMMDDVSENDKDNENDMNSDSKDETESEAQAEMETDAADELLKEIEDDISKPDEDDKSVGGGSEKVGNDAAGNTDEITEPGQVGDSGTTTPAEVDELSQATCTSDTSTVVLDSDPLTKKRPSSAADPNEETPSKKIKLTPEELKEKQRIKSLISFAQYMKQQSLKSLTRSDLEEFCVQKITEVIVHRSELGEINQQLRQQEQMVEMLRKDQQQLSKQVRDLEIVNKKLMTELRVNSGIKKPLVPLKITRSVGLQVKLQPQTDGMTAAKRRMLPQNPKTPSSGSPMMTNSTNNNSAISRVVQRPLTTATPTRPSAQSPQKNTSSTPTVTPTVPNRRSQPNTPVKNTIPLRPKPPEGKTNSSHSVIDLTDEDDKQKDNNKKGDCGVTKKTVTNTTPNRTIATLGPGVRLAAPTQVKSTPLTGVVNNTGCGPQLMYVLQPGTQLPPGMLTSSGGQKAVLLNFQSNGILTPTSNGSSVSVIPKSTANIQSIQTKTVKSIRHPAPLPMPPSVRFTGSGTHKPIPPKPLLGIKKTDTGIILQWKMPYDMSSYENIASYQLYAYQETNSPPSTDMWRKVGDVKALALPMACTLTQFADKNKYYFAVRAIDVFKRIGAFSDPEEISL